MRNLFCLLFLFAFSYAAFSQQNNGSLASKNEYLELRIIPKQGLSFRLDSNMPYQRVGAYNRRLKPYFAQYDESMRYFRQHQLSYVGAIGSSTAAGFGLLFAIYGDRVDDTRTTVIGSSGFVLGLSLTYWLNHINATSLYKAIDAYNANSNPDFKRKNYLEVIYHPNTIWQYRTSTSDDYQSVGLYGKNLKAYFENDVEANSAYKKYRIGHMTTSLGGLVSLTGVGMWVAGIWTSNNDLELQGLITALGGSGIGLIGSIIMRNNLYNAVDLINLNQSSPLNSSWMPSIQPSSHSAGLGLVWSID